MDLLGPLPKTPWGNLHILVMTDRSSKLVVPSGLPDIRAIIVAKAYIEGWVAYFGPPVIILTGNGSQFRSKLMAVVNKILGVKATNTTAYRPRTNGQVERFNSTLRTAITPYAATQNSWELELATAIYAYNRTPNEATGYAPFELVLSRAPAALEIAADWDFVDIASTPSPTEFRNAFLRHVSKSLTKSRISHQDASKIQEVILFTFESSIGRIDSQ
jgi:hypothetical protein